MHRAKCIILLRKGTHQLITSASWYIRGHRSLLKPSEKLFLGKSRGIYPHDLETLIHAPLPANTVPLSPPPL